MTSLRYVVFVLAVLSLRGAPVPSGNEMAMNFLRGQVERIEKNASAAMEDFKTPEGRERRRQEALEMFGLSPMPERGDLKATITGRHERDGVVVENLHFQSSPGLYVTANLYLPAKVEKKLPTILYLCGHAVVKTNGVSYGNKVGYQHHGAWFAKNGYACLLIDTIQLGEIEGIHHGTHREGMWWWNSRGYSPAGVEAWNAMRALDYLETRPEVDKEKFGVTGRSGGGAYSWSLVALDSRVKVAAPVAGITDLRNHVIDGAVEGHCDCMYFVNTFGWDYPMLAALAAPRPLLIVNTDSDTIFPLDGVIRTHRYVAEIYKSLKQGSKLGLVIGPGPHKDTQDIQVPVFRWFNQQLKGQDPLIAEPARKFFTGQELKVFDKIPEDQRVTTLHEWFVPKAASTPADIKQLKEKVFRNWPDEIGTAPMKLMAAEDGGRPGNLEVYEIETDRWTRLRLYRIKPKFPSFERNPDRRFIVLDHEVWKTWMNSLSAEYPKTLREEAAAVVGHNQWGSDSVVGRETWYFAPRGVGLSEIVGEPKVRAHLLRRFMLVGTTLDSMRVWDIQRALQAIGNIDYVRGEGEKASVNALMAVRLSEALAPKFERRGLPATLKDGPDYLNFLRFVDESELLSKRRAP